LAEFDIVNYYDTIEITVLGVPSIQNFSRLI